MSYCADRPADPAPVHTLLLSLATEAPIAAAVVAIGVWCRPAKAAAAAIVGTLATHRLDWEAVFVATDHIDWGAAVLLVEAAVVIAEAIISRTMTGLSIPRALLVSVFANAGSTALGFALWLVGVE